MPAWLATRMAQLGAVICQAIVLHYGRDEFLRRLAHPFWFQSFGAVMGMDWHSSGITTSVIGALKRGLAPLGAELGIYVCGGRGKHSRRTPEELRLLAERLGIDGEVLVRTSRLVAKVDSAAVVRDVASSGRAALTELATALRHPVPGLTRVTVASERRIGRPGGAQELIFGDGAAAAAVGSGPAIATFVAAPGHRLP